MTLPIARNTTYAAGSQVKSADLDAMQDCIVGMKKPNHWTWAPLGRGVIETNIAWDQTLGFYNGRIEASAGASQYDFPLGGPVVGDRITDIGILVANPGAAAGASHVYVHRVNAPGGYTLVAQLDIASVAATAETKYTVALGTPEVVQDGYSYVVSIKLGAAGMQAAGFGFAKDRL